MKKRIIWSSVSIAIVMVVLPVAYLFAPVDAGMILLMMSFLAINPVFSAVLGACMGSCLRELWYIPLISAAVYWITVTCIFGFNGAFAMYAAFYLALSYIAAGVRKLLPKE